MREAVNTRIVQKFEALTYTLGLNNKNTSKRLLEMIAEKAFNARVGFAVKRYCSTNFQRGGKSENSTAFRTDIKVKTEKKGSKSGK